MSKRGYPTQGSGMRSQLEERIAAGLDKARVPFDYEAYKIKYVKPASNHHYSPDFLLHNGIIIEAKGLLDLDDRKKHLLLKSQYPMLDIRFVFSSHRTKISSGSKTTVAEWADKHNIKWAEKVIPAAWLKEPKKEIPAGALIPTAAKLKEEEL